VVIIKYLVFDLEYASSKGGVCKICEFGYVVTNEKFDILKKGNFIIDPYINRRDWDWRVVKTILTRPIYVYEKSPRFDEYYDDIYDLINSVDYIFGHSLDGDAKALNDDCKRYELSSIDFAFYDIKQLYKEYSSIKRDVSVTEILDNLGIKGDAKTHDAEADAYNTMLELKGMLESLDLSLEDLITLCPDVKNQNSNYVVESIVKNQKKREDKLKESLTTEGNNRMYGHNDNKIRFLQFLDNVRPIKEIEQSLKGLKFSISINYEENHYRQMLNIVQILCNLGATYIMKASLADYFVTYDVFNEDGTTKTCSKSKYVNEAINNGSNIKIILFNEFLKMLNTNEEELDNMPMVSFDCLYREDAVIKDKKTLRALNKGQSKKKESKPNTDGATLGDMFADFFKDFKK